MSLECMPARCWFAQPNQGITEDSVAMTSHEPYMHVCWVLLGLHCVCHDRLNSADQQSISFANPKQVVSKDKGPSGKDCS